MLTASTAMWRALRDRDTEADGGFVYSVRTTGIYSRPSCPARQPRGHHVVFFATHEEAERAGYRACRRCRPDRPARHDRYIGAVLRSCRAMDRAEQPPSLTALADAAGFSPFYFHRTFRATTGLTPHHYFAARRFERFRRELQRADTVTEAIYRAGYGSSGHFYSRAGGLLGMTPSRFRDGGTGAVLDLAVTSVDPAVGPEGTSRRVLVAVADQGVCEVLIGDSESALVDRLGQRFPCARELRRTEGLQAMLDEVSPAAELPPEARALPQDIRVLAFTDRVRRALNSLVLTHLPLAVQEGTETLRGA